MDMELAMETLSQRADHGKLEAGDPIIDV